MIAQQRLLELGQIAAVRQRRYLVEGIVAPQNASDSAIPGGNQASSLNLYPADQISFMIHEDQCSGSACAGDRGSRDYFG